MAVVSAWYESRGRSMLGSTLTSSTDGGSRLDFRMSALVDVYMGLNVPGRLPEFMSFIPALIAAVSSELVYLSLPHVTVPEGRDRPEMLAAKADDAERRASASDLNNIVAVSSRAGCQWKLREPGEFADRHLGLLSTFSFARKR